LHPKEPTNLEGGREEKRAALEGAHLFSSPQACLLFGGEEEMSGHLRFSNTDSPAAETPNRIE
jgi:hypothetical protein